MNQISWHGYQTENRKDHSLSAIFIQYSAIDIRWVFSHAKLTISWLQWLEKRWGARARWWAIYSQVFNWQSPISRQIRYVFNVRVHEGGLNDAINYAQKGCAMQMWGITLRTLARKFSNIDFFLKILPLKDDELVMSEM